MIDEQRNELNYLLTIEQVVLHRPSNFYIDYESKILLSSLLLKIMHLVITGNIKEINLFKFRLKKLT